MEFLSAYHTDIGTKKRTNQDSMLLMEAATSRGDVTLAVICDGMGGLAQGEIVSAVTCIAFQQWFINQLPVLVEEGLGADVMKRSWEDVLYSVNGKVLDYSEAQHVSCGTTAVALLLTQDSYYVINVGDSRVYLLADSLYQLTTDHTVVQREVEQGLLTPEQAERDPRSNILLQCIGATTMITPEFVHGEVKPDSVFMLCSDGFRHQIEPREFWEYLHPRSDQGVDMLQGTLAYLTDLNKHRREDDNISALAIRVVQGG